MRLATGSGDGTAKVWDWRDMSDAALQTYPHDAAVVDVAVAPDFTLGVAAFLGAAAFFGAAALGAAAFLAGAFFSAGAVAMVFFLGLIDYSASAPAMISMSSVVIAA